MLQEYEKQSEPSSDKEYKIVIGDVGTGVELAEPFPIRNYADQIPSDTQIPDLNLGTCMPPDAF
ncbi:MAG: hypothetical protein V1870_02075 [Candidatus Aenigmatarchaeota archaeon]